MKLAHAKSSQATVPAVPAVATTTPKAGITAPAFPEGLLTTKEIAPRLFIKPKTAALWARQEKIPAFKIGRKLAFKWTEVEQALKKIGEAPAKD